MGAHNAVPGADFASGFGPQHPVEEAVLFLLELGYVAQRLLSLAHQALVLGTSNKTEILLGYTTWFGDSAASIQPIGDLYKTQVRALSRAVGVPQPILEKKPSADLWPGQTDESELGIQYDEVDQVLYLLVDERVDANRVVQLGFSEALVARIVKLVKNMQYKRMMPIIAKVGSRTPGVDFRYPRDWGR